MKVKLPKILIILLYIFCLTESQMLMAMNNTPFTFPNIPNKLHKLLSYSKGTSKYKPKIEQEVFNNKNTPNKKVENELDSAIIFDDTFSIDDLTFLVYQPNSFPILDPLSGKIEVNYLSLEKLNRTHNKSTINKSDSLNNTIDNATEGLQITENKNSPDNQTMSQIETQPNTIVSMPPPGDYTKNSLDKNPQKKERRKSVAIPNLQKLDCIQQSSNKPSLENDINIPPPISLTPQNKGTEILANNYDILKSSMIDNITNIINFNRLPNSAAAASGEQQFRKFNVWGKIFGSKNSAKAANDPISHNGFILGAGYHLTSNILLTVFGGKNFDVIHNNNSSNPTSHIPISFGGVYSKIDLSPKLNVEIKAGGLKKVGLSAVANNIINTQNNYPPIDFFVDLITNYNIQLSSSLGVVATLGVKAQKDSDANNTISAKTKTAIQKQFLFGASFIGKKFAVNKITLSSSLHMFQQLDLDKIVTSGNVISKIESNKFTMGGLVSGEYANRQFNIMVNFVNSNNYSGFDYTFNTQINL